MQDRVPGSGVADGFVAAVSGMGRAYQRDGWQADQGIIAHLADGFQSHISGPLHCPFIVLFEQDCADEGMAISPIVGSDGVV